MLDNVCFVYVYFDVLNVTFECQYFSKTPEGHVEKTLSNIVIKCIGTVLFSILNILERTRKPNVYPRNVDIDSISKAYMTLLIIYLLSVIFNVHLS